jgi:hypothetical protein
MCLAFELIKREEKRKRERRTTGNKKKLRGKKKKKRKRSRHTQVRCCIIHGEVRERETLETLFDIHLDIYRPSDDCWGLCRMWLSIRMACRPLCGRIHHNLPTLKSLEGVALRFDRRERERERRGCKASDFFFFFFIFCFFFLFPRERHDTDGVVVYLGVGADVQSRASTVEVAAHFGGGGKYPMTRRVGGAAGQSRPRKSECNHLSFSSGKKNKTKKQGFYAAPTPPSLISKALEVYTM